MKNIQKLKFAAFAAFITAGASVKAQTQITIATVQVGNTSNTADANNHGAVAYGYAIGTYEVTNAQYAGFLNAVAATDTYNLYNINMNSHRWGGITRFGPSGSYTYAVKSGFELKPVNYVSFWDATRFTNWLSNGQGSGSTETGSYTLGSVANPVNASVERNAGAKWVMTSENEWYKAAYYDPRKTGGAGGYWLHATRSDSLGDNKAFTAINVANHSDGDFANGGFSGPGSTDIGAYVNAASTYGTFDQGGNLMEWTESISGAKRGVRGGSWLLMELHLRSSFRSNLNASDEGSNIGFRIASLAASKKN
jgi:formylglycine-generating enzyme required for sulfatase activity